MKRGGPLQRRTPLKAKTPLKSNSTLKSTKPLGRESTKRKAERPDRQRVREITLKRANYQCQLARLVPDVECWGPLDVDEIAARGVAPGSHLNEDVTIAVCRRHHDWRTQHPAEAYELGARITGGEYDRRHRT
jgi:hypothetical protein